VAINKNQAKLPKHRTVSQAKLRTSSAHGRCTLNQIASMLGIGKERVRQIEASALVKLRQRLQDRGITACDLLKEKGQSTGSIYEL